MRKKLLIISDHAMSTSGVATQSLHLIDGLIKTEKYEIIQIGAAMFHNDYNTRVINENFKIIPCNGFGSKPLIRKTLEVEKPDALMLITDPRYFMWLFNAEGEIRKNISFRKNER